MSGPGYQVAGRGRYVLTRPIAFNYGDRDAGMILTVPAGYHFDVSIPRALSWILDPGDRRFVEAAALHDFALMLGWEKVMAAAPFSARLRISGVGRFKRLAMVLAVIIWKWS